MPPSFYVSDDGSSWALPREAAARILAEAKGAGASKQQREELEEPSTESDARSPSPAVQVSPESVSG